VTNRKAFYKQVSTFWEDSKSTEMVCCMSEAREEEGHCLLVWCWTLRGMFSRLPH
jgi:hypothetical protein